MTATISAAKTAFVICPLGPVKSSIRNRSDWLLSAVIKPELESAGYRVKRAAWSPMIHMISDEISTHLYTADLVIADVTDANPNVMYELGRRQSWGMHCLLVASETYDPRDLPFDIRNHPIVLAYKKTVDSQLIESYRATLGAHVAEIVQSRPTIALHGSEEQRRDIATRLAGASGLSFLVGRYDGAQDHYQVSQRLMKRRVRRLFLMQRSSSLVLGPEQGWNWEKRFYDLVMEKLNEGTELFHLISLEGISRHLKRRNSSFPGTRTVEDRLQRIKPGSTAGGTQFAIGDIVGLTTPQGKINMFKKLAPEGEETFKPDRQARTLIAEFEDGVVEGVVVVDLGGTQTAFLMSGPEMKEWLEECLNYWYTCDYLYWTEVEATLGGGAH
jgi:hypothetical protein